MVRPMLTDGSAHADGWFSLVFWPMQTNGSAHMNKSNNLLYCNIYIYIFILCDVIYIGVYHDFICSSVGSFQSIWCCYCTVCT